MKTTTGDQTIPASQALFTRAEQVLPGGVNSPVRAYRAVGGTPRFITRAQGSRVWDADGNELVDYVGAWGPMILGHRPPAVIAAIERQLASGLAFGAPTALEVDMAETITRLVPSIEMVRLVSSGTEATMAAIRLARAVTGRARIIKFEGCYHGHGDSFLVKAGSGAATFGTPDSPGVTPSTARDTLTARFNDAGSVRELFASHPAEVAAVIVEPVVGNMGVVAPAWGFLQDLRDLCTADGALLIFDEVMTGFRLARGGAQEKYGVTPDLTTLGKIIGGGLAVGAFGGRADVMNPYDPRDGKGRINHGGTFNANPLTMAGGIATMEQLTPEAYARLDALGDRLRDGVRRLLRKKGYAGQITGTGSLFWLHHTKKKLSDYRSARPEDPKTPARAFLGLVNGGVLLSQRGLGACSLAMTDADVDRFVETLGRVLY